LQVIGIKKGERKMKVDALEWVCDELDVDRDVITGKSKFGSIVAKRWIIACFLYKLGYNYSHIGRKIWRDHSTVMHALDNATESMWDTAYHLLVKYDDFIAPKKKVPNYGKSRIEVVRC
jgi:chromosomal replication initiation ATPase DnaA